MFKPGLAINAATTRQQWPLLQAIDNYARIGVSGIAPWRDQLHEVGASTAYKALRASGLAVTSLCRGGMFPAATEAGRRAAIEDNRRAIEEAATIGAPVLVLVCGGLPEGSRDVIAARAMVRDGIAAILPWANAAGVRLAIEPLHPMYAADRNCINTLDQALDLCDALDASGTQGLGTIFDVYHLWWDPNILAATRRASGRILGFHISDWTVPIADTLNDRGMMGDGVIDIAGLAHAVLATGYDGYAEVEIFSNFWWRKDPDYVVKTAIDRWSATVDVLSRQGLYET